MEPSSPVENDVREPYWDIYIYFLQLEDELSNLLGEQNQIATSKQALELTRLMVKADTSDDRSTLLKILRVSFSISFCQRANHPHEEFPRSLVIKV